MVHKFTVRPCEGAPASSLVQLRLTLGLPDLEVRRDYYVEVERALGGDEIDAICGVLGDGVVERAEPGQDIRPGRMVQVAHRRGIVDNESDSIAAACRLLGIPATGGKVAQTYVSARPGLRAAVEAWCCNPNIEELHEAEPCYPTLVPAGEYRAARRHDLRALDDQELLEVGRGDGRNLDLRQMRQVRAIQEATAAPHVTDALLEALDARWSDHCSHTTWRAHGDLLRRLVDASRSTGNPNIVSMFHDNAGVWDFYDGWSVAIKGETHNGPAAISAYFGQLTKLGGVLRDILGTGLGADPVGCFEYTATGPPEAPPAVAGRPGSKQVALDTIRAVKEYGNTFGVPMIRSHLSFHAGYRAKPFALGGCIGLVPTASAQRGTPRPGDMVLLIGGLTGNDGIHGASAASVGSTMEGTAVQIGAPLEEVKFRRAIVDLRDAGCLRALTDIGGAGLNSAVGEIGEACGVWINTALVPLKTAGLPMWRILLSESQERMLLAVPPERLEGARRILARHEVRATVIGRFVESRRYTVFHHPGLDEAAVVERPAGAVPDQLGELGFDVDYELLADDPDPVVMGDPPAPAVEPAGWPALGLDRLPAIARELAADPEVASQAFSDRQYDSTVQGNTVHGPQYGSRERVRAAYWAATPLDGSPAAVVVSTAFNPWLFEVDPVRALRQLFCGLLGTQVLAGVALGDICVCDNFYTPHLDPHGGEWLVAMVDELAALVRCFRTPVISGKDSSAGSTETDEGVVSVPPAVFLSGLGKVPDATGLLPEQWAAAGNLLVRLGPPCGSSAGTVGGRILRCPAGGLDDISPVAYRAYLEALQGSREGLRSGSPIGPGGVLGGLLTGAMAGDLGIDTAPSEAGLAGLLAEHRCGALVEVSEEDLAALPAALSPVVLGRLSQTPGVRIGGRDVLTPDVVEAWSSSFAARLR